MFENELIFSQSLRTVCSPSLPPSCTLPLLNFLVVLGNAFQKIPRYVLTSPTYLNFVICHKIPKYYIEKS